MNIVKEKIALIDWLGNINDETIINQLNSIKDTYSQKSNLSREQEQAIDKGLISFEKGNFKTHEELKKDTISKFPNLFK